MNIRMRRKGLPENGWENPGLFFDRGFKQWNIQDDGERGKNIRGHIDASCIIEAPNIYRNAFRRWQSVTGDPNRFAIAAGRINGRLYIGLGMPHVLETQVTRNQTYGMPCIPGSALKGLARAWSRKDKDKGGGMTEEVVNVLFGCGSDDPEKADAGYLVFHDAWWIPDTGQQPYAPEVVTVHVGKYYQEKGENCPHPDMESPNPNNQIAVQGRFYFVVEGMASWAALGMRYLQQALEEGGVGGKVSSGYGYFIFEEADQKKTYQEAKALFEKQKQRREKWLRCREEQRKKEWLETLTPFQRAVYELEQQVATCKQTTFLSNEHKQCLNRMVNRVLEAGTTAAISKEERGKSVEIIRCVYEITCKKTQGIKKMEKVMDWVD